MNKNLINPEILQPFLDSATNAADKGQAQYLTPPELAALLSAPLPAVRPNLVDFNSGAGHLLRAAANQTTLNLLAGDIDPSCQSALQWDPDSKSRFLKPSIANSQFSILNDPKKPHLPDFTFIPADLTLLAELLHQANFQSDLFVLNPPWDLHWHRDRLKHLANSRLAAVAEAFKAIDPRLGRDTIDSSVATLLLALHHCTDHGEGFLITNAATADRLILDESAPHHALAKHLWATVRFPMSLFNSKPDNLRPDNLEPSPQAICLYFARDHVTGPRLHSSLTTLHSPLPIDRSHRSGRQILWADQASGDSRRLWEGCGRELTARHSPLRTDFNLWLDHSGTIGAHLSIFDQATLPSRDLQKQADILHGLADKTPLFLVTQRAQRDLLLQSVGLNLSTPHSPLATSATPWRVDPKLITAVQQALHDYNSVRAPLYPLPKIQRLGYLEEENTILCTKDLSAEGANQLPIANSQFSILNSPSPLNAHSEVLTPPHSPPTPLFTAGRHYKLKTRTITVKRTGQRPNLEGETETIEYTGAELATLITANDDREYSFLEARLKSKDVRVKDLDPATFKANPNQRRRKTSDRDAAVARADDLTIDFTLNQLIDHFEIPNVADISSTNPQLHQQNLARLDEIQTAMPAHLRLKLFQRDDYARLAIPDGAILAHDPGLGKTWAAILIPLLKCGFTKVPITNSQFSILNFQLRPNAPVLIVAPGDLHQQMIEEVFATFGITITRLDSQETFLSLCAAHAKTLRAERANQLPILNSQFSIIDHTRTIPPGFYITSFTRLGLNGAAKPPELDNLEPENLELLSTIGAWNYEGPNHTIIEVKQRIKCLYSPTLADLCGNSFACYIVDEATKMKSDDAQIAQAVRQLGLSPVPQIFNSQFSILNSQSPSPAPNSSLATRHSPLPYKFALTATPIKNRIPDLFWLAWWTSGAQLQATPRFPYSVLEKMNFAETFCVMERNLTAEHRADEQRKPRRFQKLTPQVCNVHRLWKMLAPIVLRRRKKDIGEDIAGKHNHVIRIPMGSVQASLYSYLIDWEPPDKNGRLAVGRLLQSLRMAAAAPHNDSLRGDLMEAIAQRHGRSEPSPSRSLRLNHSQPDPLSTILTNLSIHTPKTHAALNLILQILNRRQQVILFAPFNEPLDTLYYLLETCGIPAVVMDGRTDQAKRGQLAADFKKGPPSMTNSQSSPLSSVSSVLSVNSVLIRQRPDQPSAAAANPACSKYPIMLAGNECMAEGHNFFRCANAIFYSYSWALDKTIQAVDRIHRLTSPAAVNIYRLVADGSIDRKMESQLDEKEDSAELILDGHLIGEQPHETNLMELLRHAQRDFDPSSKTIPESALKQQWPDLRQKLTAAYQLYLHGAKSPVTTCHSPLTTHQTIGAWRARLRPQLVAA